MSQRTTFKLPALDIVRIPTTIDNSVSTYRDPATQLDFMLEELNKAPLMLPRQPTALLQTEKKDNSSKGKSIFSSPVKKTDSKTLPIFALSNIFSKLEITTQASEEIYSDDFEDIATLEALSLDSKIAPVKKA